MPEKLSAKIKEVNQNLDPKTDQKSDDFKAQSLKVIDGIAEIQRLIQESALEPESKNQYKIELDEFVNQIFLDPQKIESIGNNLDQSIQKIVQEIANSDKDIYQEKEKGARAVTGAAQRALERSQTFKEVEEIASKIPEVEKGKAQEILSELSQIAPSLPQKNPSKFKAIIEELNKKFGEDLGKVYQRAMDLSGALAFLNSPAARNALKGVAFVGGVGIWRTLLSSEKGLFAMPNINLETWEFNNAALDTGKYFVPFVGNIFDFKDAAKLWGEGHKLDAGISIISGTLGMGLDLVSLFPAFLPFAQGGKWGLKSLRLALKAEKAGAFTVVRKFGGEAFKLGGQVIDALKRAISSVTPKQLSEIASKAGHFIDDGVEAVSKAIMKVAEIPYIGKILKPITWMLKETIESVANVISFKVLRKPKSASNLRDALKSARAATEAKTETIKFENWETGKQLKDKMIDALGESNPAIRVAKLEKIIEACQSNMEAYKQRINGYEMILAQLKKEKKDPTETKTNIQENKQKMKHMQEFFSDAQHHLEKAKIEAEKSPSAEPQKDEDTTEEIEPKKPEDQIKPEEKVKNEYQKGKVVQNIDNDPLHHTTPEKVETKNGAIHWISDQGIGYKNRNEDALYFNTEENIFMVADGMGGMGSGDKASKIFMESMHDAINGRLTSAEKAEIQKLRKTDDFDSDLGQPKDPLENQASLIMNKDCPRMGQSDFPLTMKEIQYLAYKRMKAQNVGSGGVCYIATKIEGDTLHVFQGGDVRLIVIDQEGKVRDSTEDEGYLNAVTNPITGEQAGKTKYKQIKMRPGDRILIASDGLTDNFHPDTAKGNQEIATLIKGKTADGAVAALKEYSNQRMDQEYSIFNNFTSEILPSITQKFFDCFQMNNITLAEFKNAREEIIKNFGEKLLHEHESGTRALNETEVAWARFFVENGDFPGFKRDNISIFMYEHGLANQAQAKPEIKEADLASQKQTPKQSEIEVKFKQKITALKVGDVITTKGENPITYEILENVGGQKFKIKRIKDGKEDIGFKNIEKLKNELANKAHEIEITTKEEHEKKQANLDRSLRERQKQEALKAKISRPEQFFSKEGILQVKEVIDKNFSLEELQTISDILEKDGSMELAKKILRVTGEPNQKLIKQNYLALSLEFNPNLNPYDLKSTKMFQIINAAKQKMDIHLASQKLKQKSG